MRQNTPLLTTKFFIPSSSHEFIARTRLYDYLNTGLHGKLTLLSAPAGYGKTVLLAQWLQTISQDEWQVCWVSLDEGDNDPWVFWTYVLAALDHK